MTDLKFNTDAFVNPKTPEEALALVAEVNRMTDELVTAVGILAAWLRMNSPKC